MTSPIIQVRSTPKMKLSCYDRSDQVASMIKTRHDNDVTDYTGAIYIENEIDYS